MVTSNKSITSGHRFRHIITNHIVRNNINVDIYGGNYNKLPYMTSQAFTPEHSGRHITKW
jgi:hypothetical protein